jgi:hypothetical protein
MIEQEAAWLPVRLHREVHVKVRDRAGDQRQQLYAAVVVYRITDPPRRS